LDFFVRELLDIGQHDHFRKLLGQFPESLDHFIVGELFRDSVCSSSSRSLKIRRANHLRR
jgi:hypothetical protein